jgi:hypothetical protein
MVKKGLSLPLIFCAMLQILSDALKRDKGFNLKFASKNANSENLTLYDSTFGFFRVLTDFLMLASAFELDKDM